MGMRYSCPHHSPTGRYRPTITKLIAVNNQKRRELKRYLSDIKSLRILLAETFESTRNDLSCESSENVRFSTYVTVVFLPMGFATALLSMSTAPAGRFIGEMVGAALITLMATGFVLAYAHNIVEVFDKLVPFKERRGVSETSLFPRGMKKLKKRREE